LIPVDIERGRLHECDLQLRKSHEEVFNTQQEIKMSLCLWCMVSISF